MLSRVADNLYWMSRYLERTEQTIRLLDINLNYTLDQSAVESQARWDRLCSVLLIDEQVVEPTALAVTQWLISDRENPGSVVSMIGAIRFNASQIRQQLSTEVWTKVNQLYHRVNKAVDTKSIVPRLFFTDLVETIQLIQGLIATTMVHKEPWHYLQLGRYVERGMLRTALLIEHLSFDATHQDWVAVLRNCVSYEPYCAEYTADIQPHRIVDFLLLNPRSPQSVRFSAEQIYDSLKEIQKMTGIESPPQRLSGRIRCNVSHIIVGDLFKEFEPVEYLADIRDKFEQLHNAIYATYIVPEEVI